MTIAWTGSGGLFTILGRYFNLAGNINGYRGVTAPSVSSAWGSGGAAIHDVETCVDNIVAQHTAAQNAYIDGLRTDEASYITAHDSFMSSLQRRAESTLISIVNADTPLPDSNLQTAMVEMIRQFSGATQSVLRCAVARTVTAGGSNVGVPTVICSVTGRTGNPQEYAIAETMVLKAVTDKNTGETAGSEVLKLTGGAKGTNKLATDWPKGSGAAVDVAIVDPELDATSNLLTNSNFETFTVANTPDNWTVTIGTIGTTVLKSTSNVYASSFGSAACLQIVGNGSQLTELTQAFGAAAGSGTTAELKPATVYGFNVMLRTSAAPATGILAFSLVDGSGSVISDDATTANTISSDLTALTAATYTSVSGFFRTPTNLPSTVKLRIKVTTAIETAFSVNIDYMAMCEATQAYAGGPYVAAFRGTTDVVAGDRWTIAITNDRAGAIQTYFEKFFGMSDLGLILPSLASSNTINENLIA